jgi:hypothetical protein
MTRTRKLMTQAEYERRVPKASRKWLVRCDGCGEVGYRPETPSTGVAFRRIFELLELNASGLCEQCADAVGRLPRS